jgi:hypothetical protein
MKLLYTLLLITLLASCSKTAKEKEERIFCGCQKEPAWLTTKKAEYVSCVCLMEIRQVIYQNQQVFEIRITDPLCNGINVVYRYDGSVVLTSSNQDAYNQYLSTLKSPQVIWSCTK